MDVSSPMKPPNSHGTMDESSDSDSSLISFSSAASDDIDDSFSSTSSDGPLYEMDSLRANLPFKRGLSKFFAGKSQSFTSLSDVKCLNDLAKPENPYKKMKSSHSYGGLLNCQSYPPQHSSRCSAKKPHKGNSTSPNKGSLIPNRPPVTPLRNR